MEYLRFDLGGPLARLVTANQHHGQHWGRTHTDKVQWREGMVVLAKKHRIDQRVHGRPCLVRFAYPVPDNRRRDPSNLVGTVVKWSVDGLVKAGVWPDDTPQYVSVLEPLLVVGGSEVILELWAKEQA